MIFENLTLTDITTAYRKIKSIAYYDTYDLFMKAKIASFETKRTSSDDDLTIFDFEPINFEKKLIELHKALTSWPEEKRNRYWDKRYKQINYRVLPKKIKNTSIETGSLIGNLFTNVREIDSDQDYEIEKLTFYIDVPIEIHIVSILWIMKIGYLLEKDFDEKCFGNRLILEKKKANSNSQKVVEGEGLFKPYYNQYQKWRDEGITVAKQYLDKKQSVLFINIDIKDYYYSVRFTFDSLRQALLKHDSYYLTEDLSTLVEVFEQIHLKYTELIKETRYPNDLIKNISKDESILPIGLASSYILANWYLQKFDSRVHQHIRPIYYSRYVDDIFLITANPDPKFSAQEDCDAMLHEIDKKFNQNVSASFSETEQYIIKTLYPVIKIEKTPTEIQVDNKNEWIFQIECYDNLYIQPSKTLVYFFDHNSSQALLEKFKHEQEMKSSEFRFLPDEKLENGRFDDEAYELIFDDSLNKVKTLKDYRENRYGIASHLSKKIFYSLRNGHRNTKEDAQKILKFFKGTTNLEHFRQWERLITYFVVNGNHEEFLEFSINTFEQIFRLPLGNEYNGFNLSYLKVAEDLLEYYCNAMEMALALDPTFSLPHEEKITKTFNRFYGEFSIINDRPQYIFKNWQRLRHSNMLRHTYVNIPLLNYTDISVNSSLLESDFSKIGDINNIDYSEDHINYSPRKVRYCEVAWMECIKRVYATPDVKPIQNRVTSDLLYDENDQYLEKAFDTYYKINYWYKSDEDEEFRTRLKRELFDYGEVLQVKETTTVDSEEEIVSQLFAHEISVNQKEKLTKLRVGLANMNVDEHNYEKSMFGCPNLTNRYKQFAKILNEGESEECDLIVLPELSLPHGLVKTILDYSWNHQRAVISGIEHWTHNDVAYNFILTVLPCTVMGVKDAVPILRLKNHYSPLEEFWINDYRKSVPKPKPYRYHLLRWKGLYFTNYYCFELADIIHRAIFRSKIDFLVASEWNPDINYYSNITELTARDIHCYFIQVNTSQYGDSRVTRPTKTEQRDSLKIKGGLNTVLVVDELRIDLLRAFQYKGFGQQKEDKTFKPTPADYNHDDARKRQENKSFKKSR